MKNLTDFRKTVETGVDPRLGTVFRDQLETTSSLFIFHTMVIVA